MLQAFKEKKEKKKSRNVYQEQELIWQPGYFSASEAQEWQDVK